MVRIRRSAQSLLQFDVLITTQRVDVPY